MKLQGCQIRMARAALRLSLTDLAMLSGVSEKTIRRCEAVDGPPPVSEITIASIHDALFARGVRFTEGRRLADGPGVTLDWNPAAGTRREVLSGLVESPDPMVRPRYVWPPLPLPPVPPRKPKR